MPMKVLPGAYHPWPALKSLSDGVGRMCCFNSSQKKYEKIDSKLERKMIEIKRNAEGLSNFRSINGIILKFPQFREGLKEISGVFQQFDEDCNGNIDREELQKCLKKLHLDVSEEEIDDLFCACDIDENEGIQLNEFMVLLCLFYVLMDSSASSHNRSEGLSPELQATFSTIIEAFLFLDKNGDGKLHKQDVIQALNEDTPWEKSPAHKNWTLAGKERLVSEIFSLFSSVGLVLTLMNRITRRVKAKSLAAGIEGNKTIRRRFKLNECEYICILKGPICQRIVAIP